MAGVILVTGMAIDASGVPQQVKPFDSETLPQDVITVYKLGLPFKQYLSETIKNPASAQLIKSDLGSANIQCGGEGPDVRTNKVICNPAISFMNQTCTIDSTISRNCEHAYIAAYLHSQKLNETQQGKFSYIFLANSAVMNHPGSATEELLALIREIK